MAHIDKVINIYFNRNKIQIKASEILFMKGYGNYTYIYTTCGKCYLFSKTMKHALGVLDCFFIRIHRSYCLNPDYFVKILGNDRVILTSGQELPIARRRISYLLEIASQRQSSHDSQTVIHLT